MRKLRLAALILLVALATGYSRAQTPAPPAASPAAAITAPAHPATAAQIKEYFVLTRAIDSAHTMMDQMVTSMQATGNPAIPKSFWDDMRVSVRGIDLEAAFIPAYQRYFSTEDMAQVLVFYRSPAGQRMLAAQPLIVADAQQVLRAAGQKLGEEVYERHKAEFETASPAASPKP